MTDSVDKFRAELVVRQKGLEEANRLIVDKMESLKQEREDNNRLIHYIRTIFDQEE